MLDTEMVFKKVKHKGKKRARMIESTGRGEEDQDKRPRLGKRG